MFSAGGNYTGRTTVGGGVLQLLGNLASNGGVTVSSAALPRRTGERFDLDRRKCDARWHDRRQWQRPSLTGGLTLGDGSASIFTIPSTPNGTALIATSGASPTSLAITGNHTINIFGAPDQTPGNYTYNLISYTGEALALSVAAMRRWPSAAAIYRSARCHSARMHIR